MFGARCPGADGCPQRVAFALVCDAAVRRVLTLDAKAKDQSVQVSLG
jgi:hypothetical protein